MKEALRVLVYQSLSFGLQIVFVLLAARGLGAEQQGTYAIFRTSAYLIEALMWLGLTGGVPYFIATNFDRYHNAIVISSGLYIFAGIVIGLPVIILVLPHFQIPPTTGLLIAAWVVSLACVQFFLKIFLGQRRFGLYNFVNILTSVSLFAPFGAFVITGQLTVEKVVVCNVIANLSGLTVSSVAHWEHLRRVCISDSIMKLIPEFFSVGLKGYLSGIVYQLLFRVDFFLVGYFYPKSLGLYSLAVFVVEAVQKVPDWLGLVLSPRISAGLDPNHEVTRRFLISALGFVSTVAAVLLVATIVGFPYLETALGPEYKGVEIVVLALMPKAALHAVVAIYGGNLAGRGYTLYHPLSGALAVVTLLVVDSVLLAEFGPNIAIVAITAAYCVAAMVMTLGVRSSAKPISVPIGAS